MKSKVCCLLMVMALLNATVANAFKIETHIWVAQQVINDLEDDGQLTIKMRGHPVTLPVPAEVRNAILGNKDAFRLGNIGPDAVPDVVAGQMAVHPGVKDGWKTHDWMEYVVNHSRGNPEATAFAYGYLGHAAGDVFAHTYVNQYAGDQFWILDGETLVEQRHYALEKYIANYTPPLVDSHGAPIGAPWTAVRMSDSLADFLRNNLVYDPEVAVQYRKSAAISRHLAAFSDFRRGVDKLAEDPIWHEFDKIALEILADEFGYDLSDAEADAVADAITPLIQYLNGPMVDVGVQDVSNGVYDAMSKFNQTLFGAAADSVQRLKDAESAFITKEQERRRKLAEIVEPPNCPRIPVCWPDPVWYNPGRISCDTRPEPVCDATRSTIIASNNAILSALEFIENELLDLKQDLIQAANEVQVEAVKAADAVKVLHNDILDFSQIPGQGILPFQPALRAWRGDIDVAMREYVKATSQMMINTMDADSSTFKPLDDWFNCYHLQLISVSSTISNCGFRDAAVTVIDSGKKIIATIEWAHSIEARLGLPSPVEIQNAIDYYVPQLKEALRNEVEDQIIAILPQKYRDLIALFDKHNPMNDSLLNTFFHKPEDELPDNRKKRLVMIDDMAARVKGEMHIVGNYFDPEKYAVAYDAVVLAKLALLDRSGLDALAAAAGVPNGTGGAPLFAGTDNVVASAFDVIDGNHQWMVKEDRPPRPNSLSPFKSDPETQHTEPYVAPKAANFIDTLVTDYASPKPFVLWNDRGARAKLFRGIFIGPLSPGIDAPQMLGQKRVLASSYPYQPCAAQPFPNDNHDRTCISVLLTPILNQVMQ